MDPTLALNQSFGRMDCLEEQQQLRSIPSHHAAGAVPYSRTLPTDHNSKHQRTALISPSNNGSSQAAASEHHSGQTSQLSEDSDMSSKSFPASAPPKPYNSSHFQPLLYPLYMNTELQVLSQAAHQLYTGNGVEGLGNIDHNMSLALQKPGASQVQLCLDEQARSGLSSEAATGRFKHWTFDQERSMQGYNLSTLLLPEAGEEAAHNNRAQQLLASQGRGGVIAGSNQLLGSSVSAKKNMVVDSFGQLSSSNNSSEQRVQQPYLARFESTRAQYSPDMEILRVSQGHNSNSSVHHHLYEAVPSAIMNQTPATHNIGVSTTTYRGFNVQNNAGSEQLDWGVNASGTHELLLLPRAESVAVEASDGTTTSAMSRSKLDLLHTSSLHDKRPLPFNGLGGISQQANNLPLPLAHSDDKQLDMAVGLHEARSMFHEDPFPSMANNAARQQSGLSLFLQSPHRQTSLSLDARFTSRSGAGSLGVLRNSKYLKAAQQLLNEFCSVGRADAALLKGNHHIVDLPQSWSVEEAANGDAISAVRTINREMMSLQYPADLEKANSSHFKSADQHHKQFPHSLQLADSQSPPTDPSEPKQLPADERYHLQMRKARLTGMVEELDRRYQQYRDNMQLIITSFESATGLGAAAPYTAVRRRAMSRQFRGLRDAIGEHIHRACKALGEELSSVPILSKGETPRLRLLDQRLRHQRALQQIGMLPQQQAWRPQRGLPERSVSVLRAWLFEHFLHPYPKDSEKLMLARLTGLSRNQVSNWFINARVRLWKPMVEEMYVEESKALELNEAGEGAEVLGSSMGAIADGKSIAAADGKSIADAGQAPSSWQATNYAASYINNIARQRDDFNCFTVHSARAEGSERAELHESAAAAGYGETIQASPQQRQSMASNNTHSDGIALLTQLQPTHMHGFNTGSIMKNGVSLTLGLQQSSSHTHTTLQPPQSSYSNAYGRPSELFRF